MPNNEKNTDQIRQLTNNVRLAGAIAEIESKEGTTTQGIPYISINGSIQCGEDPVNTVRFRSFIKSQKADGSDSKNYVTVKEWLNKCVPMTKDKENCTFVDLRGSVVSNDYVNREGRLVEGFSYNMQLFNKFTEYACQIDMEGFIHSIIDETEGEDGEPTGRKKLRLISRDIFRNTLDIKNIFIPEELVGPIEDNDYEAGRTATFFIDLIPNHKEAPVQSGGIGKQRVTEGRTYLEMVLTGANPPIDEDSDKAIPVALVKAAMNERKIHLKEIEDAGYQGSSDGGSVTDSTTRNSIGGKATSSTKTSSSKASSKKIDKVDDDDDFPF